jgi:hypothetical protein
VPTRETFKNDAASANFYGDHFYEVHTDTSFRSALKYVGLLSPLFKPDSVVDVGCGRGTWLKAFKEKGASKLVGYDGPWNTQESMIDQSIVFHSVDLNEPIFTTGAKRFDLAISLEVAEHLKPTSAKSFVESLTQFSDVVLFSAAYTQQLGSNHLNEQRHTYWAKIFSLFNYDPYDLFRPTVWGDKDISYWYQQNIFLYVRSNTPASILLVNAGHSPMQNICFMDCIHPQLYENHLYKDHILEIDTKTLIKQVILRSIPRSLRPLVKKTTGHAA